MSSKKKTTKSPSKNARTRKSAVKTIEGDSPTEFFPKVKAGNANHPKPVKAVKPVKTAKPATPKRTSALDAAAQVLVQAKQPMNAKALIEVMAERKLWTSPGGKTPHATLYAAMLREITEKGKDARFKKVERGLFAHA